jgi:hypothetical protein
MLHCAICDINLRRKRVFFFSLPRLIFFRLFSAEESALHVAGKKHTARTAELRNRIDKARRSLYLRSVPSGER